MSTATRLLAIASTSVLCLSGPALAQARNRVREGEHWEVITTAQGCRAILGYQLEMGWGPDPNVRFSWNGRCDANGLITGSGTLLTEFVSRYEFPPPETFRARTETAGAATQGLFQGRATDAIYSDLDDFNPETPPGAMALHNNNLANPTFNFYKNGCPYPIDERGKVEAYTTADCNGDDGLALFETDSGCWLSVNGRTERKQDKLAGADGFRSERRRNV